MTTNTPPPSPATPTLAEQIAWLSNEVTEQRKYREAFKMRPHYMERQALAILASLEQLASLQSRLAEVEANSAASVDGDKGEGK